VGEINSYKTLAGKPKEKMRLERHRDWWRIILKWILGKED
jgi:hypothetical protein